MPDNMGEPHAPIPWVRSASCATARHVGVIRKALGNCTNRG
jgi:hypothetical protein